MAVHLYPNPDRFVAGTIGEPGKRKFYIQARQKNRLTTVRGEKQQLQELIVRLAEALEQLRLRGEIISPAIAEPLDSAPLDLPLVEEFLFGVITIGWVPISRQIFVQLFSSDIDPAEIVVDSEDGDLERLEVFLTPQQTKEFIMVAEQVLSAGRAACPFCQQPINPQGHICPRLNGYFRDRFKD